MDNKKVTKTIRVEEEQLACAMGSGSLFVLATPAVVALMECAAAELAQNILESDGRFFYFDVTAYDNKGEIAKGTHTRVSVKAVKFQQKADGKFDEV